MFVTAPRTVSEHEVRKYVDMVEFHPKRLGRSVIVPLTFASPTSDSIKREPTIAEALTDSAVSHAETLAKWVWEHRCGKSPPNQ